MKQKEAKAIALGLLAAGALVLPVAGCGDSPSRPGESTQTEAKDAKEAAPKEVAPAQEPKPVGPQTADPGDVPTNIPRPIPTPEPPLKPGEVKLKAISHSISSYPLNPFGNYARLTNIHIDLKWQLYPGAVNYKISRSSDGTETFVAKATIPASRIVKALPLFWREYSTPLTPLVPGAKYKYLVQALNSSNQIMASGSDETSPLYPLDIPKLVSPENNAKGTGIGPSFQWERTNNADGYWVEVFAGQTFLPQWRGFRAGQEAITVKYGESGEGYPGTMPAMWTTILAPGVPYTWSVTSYKTDTGNASTAKAFAKSNTPSWIFTP